MEKNKDSQNIINANSIRLIAIFYSSILIIVFIFISSGFKILYSARNPSQYKMHLSIYTNTKTPNSISLMIGARLQEIGVSYLLYRNNIFYTKLSNNIFTDTDLIPYTTYSYQVMIEKNNTNTIIYKSNILNLATMNSHINPYINPTHINYSIYSAFGDSITQGYDTTISYFQRVSTYLKNKYGSKSFNDGVGGNTTYNLLERVEEEIQAQNPTIVTLMIGTNDLRLGTKMNPTITPLEYKQNLSKILSYIDPSSKRTVIIFLIPYLKNFSYPGYSAGSYKRWNEFNNIIIGIANKFGIPYINENLELQSQSNILSSDGIHPNNNGDKIIFNLLISKLNTI